MRKLPPASGSALPGKGVTCSVKPLVLESAELGWREYGQGSGKRWGKVKEPLARWIQVRKLVANK